MFAINGKDVIVAMNDVPIFCGKDCTFSESKELIKASTVTSGVWKEVRPRKRSWSLEVSGLTKIDATDGQDSYFNMISDTVAMQLETFTVMFTDQDLNTKTITGNGYIQRSSITGPSTGFAEPSITIVGHGLYLIV